MEHAITVKDVAIVGGAIVAIGFVLYAGLWYLAQLNSDR